MDGPETALQDMRDLYIERHPLLSKFILENKMFTEEMLEFCYHLILGWTRDQIQFVKGRQRLLEREIDWFPEHVQEVVRAQFSRGDESIAALEALFEKRVSQSFLEAVTDVY